MVYIYPSHILHQNNNNIWRGTMCRSNYRRNRIINRELNTCWMSHNAWLPKYRNSEASHQFGVSSSSAGAFGKPKSKLWNLNFIFPWPSTGLLRPVIVLRQTTASFAHFHSFHDRFQEVPHDRFVSKTTKRSKWRAGNCTNWIRWCHRKDDNKPLRSHTELGFGINRDIVAPWNPLRISTPWR